MKQFLATVAACFVALLLFALIAAAALIIIPDLIDDSSETKSVRNRTISPPGFKFLEVEEVAGTDTYSIRGVVQNSSKTTWNYSSIKARILSSGKVVTICEGMLFGPMKPLSKRAFLIECKDTQPPASGQAYQYELFVQDAMQEG